MTNKYSVARYSKRFKTFYTPYELGRRIAANNVLRRGIRNYIARKCINKALDAVVRKTRGRPRGSKNKTSKKRKQYERVVGRKAGTSNTTTRLIVRRTPRRQRMLRKLFKANPVKICHVNRFGFNWVGAGMNNKTIWYSVTHLKFNNVVKYMQERISNDPYQTLGTNPSFYKATQNVANSPATQIYVGKCVYQYEIYNPTNYLITVFIYDLVCKHDTPQGINYSDAETQNSSPEACMQIGSKSMIATGASWTVGDSTWENDTVWNSVGVKPTDYHYFNTFWKVKGVKKIILPPGSSHHHNVIYNPKKIVTQANLFYPRNNLTADSKNGIAGITQSTLFGFTGQVAANGKEESDSTNVGTLPGKITVKCIRRANIWNIPLTAKLLYSESDLVQLDSPKIFTDLVEKDPAQI